MVSDEKNVGQTTVRLGEALVRRKVITEEQLQKALEKQKETGAYLGETLIELDYAPPEIVYETLSEQVNIPWVSVRHLEIDPSLLQLVPEKFARRFSLLPLSLEGEVLRVAVADHYDIVALDTIASHTGFQVQLALCDRSELKDAIHYHYGSLTHMEETLQEVLDIEAGAEELDQPPVEELELEASDAPVVRYVNLLIYQAIERRASDLHIEPRKNSVQVRARVDGVLHNLTPPSKAMLPAVASRIKILSGMDIGERRLPQDGRCKIEEKNIDIRVSTLPTIHGEKVQMRLLDKSRLVLDLSELGFETDQQTVLEYCLQRPQGIILVTGPTGSGKTTTLYSGLSFINTEDRNIVTVEDPVEYELEGINQVQMKPTIGLTFANGLRSILRQDPDVIMVGEIRDLETAEIAVRAALTGHLVLSTLHTNDAIATVNRLSNMGVKPFLLGSSLTLIMAQRLVRKICDHCKERYDPPPAALEQLGLSPEGEFYRGAQCRRCNRTGYFDRVAVYEMLQVDKELGQLISRAASEAELRDAAEERGMVSLRQSGIQKIKAGITTVEEVIARTMQ